MMLDNRQNRIKELRKAAHINQQQLGDAIGVRKTTISNYEVGYSTPPSEVLTRLAEYFNVSIDYLLGLSEFRERMVKLKDGKRLPVYSTSAIDSIVSTLYDDVEGFMEIPSNANTRNGQLLSVMAEDNSMDNAGISKNDYVIVKRNNRVRDGQIGLVIVDGELYIRRVHIYGSKVTLVPDSNNKKYLPVQFDYEQNVINIIGKVEMALVNIS